jgi:DNA-binding response OmpR family regulator
LLNCHPADREGIKIVMSARILIVEDEMLVAMELEAILEDLGYVSVGIAPDMPTALELARLKPALALVDLNLRDGLTGPEIGRCLSGEHDASVLFMTANPRMLGAGVAGTIGVLTKPTDVKIVAAAVEYALRRKLGDVAAVPPSSLRLFG